MGSYVLIYIFMDTYIIINRCVFNFRKNPGDILRAIVWMKRLLCISTIYTWNMFCNFLNFFGLSNVFENNCLHCELWIWDITVLFPVDASKG